MSPTIATTNMGFLSSIVSINFPNKKPSPPPPPPPGQGYYVYVPMQTLSLYEWVQTAGDGYTHGWNYIGNGQTVGTSLAVAKLTGGYAGCFRTDESQAATDVSTANGWIGAYNTGYKYPAINFVDASSGFEVISGGGDSSLNAATGDIFVTLPTWISGGPS